MARSVAPSSSAPASEVIAPASNAATTSRPSTGSNPKKSGRHSVGIGALRGSTKNCCSTTVFVDSQPRCTQQCEKSALGPSLASAVHVDDLEAPLAPRDMIARLRQFMQLRENKTGHGHV